MRVEPQIVPALMGAAFARRGIRRIEPETVTDREWRDEAERMLAAVGLPWRVVAAWTEQAGTVLCADLVDTRSGRDRSIRIPAVAFSTQAERRGELVRQLQPRQP